MSKRIGIVTGFYDDYDEDSRVGVTRQGQLEYLTTMEYIHRHALAGGKLLEVGAGTGRYSIALAREGYQVTALELVPHNLQILLERGAGVANLDAHQGDALDLSRFPDGSFDMTMVLGPMYHLYDSGDVQTAIREAIRVTKKGGVLLFAFLSVYAIMGTNYLKGNLRRGMELNFTDDFRPRHFPEQLFTGYDIAEFEALFHEFPVTHLTTAAADSILELASGRSDFSITDEEFPLWVRYHLATCEKRELLGHSSHLLYICRKQ
jgi:SAM-dependent methyltransferase